MRALVRETHLRLEKMIYPLFIVEGKGVQKPISSMPGINQQSIDVMLREVEASVEAGITSFLLFGIPEKKDSQASGAWLPDGIVQKAIREIKAKFPEVLVIADTCLCEYMDHGHCGIVSEGAGSSTTRRCTSSPSLPWRKLKPAQTLSLRRT